MPCILNRTAWYQLIDEDIAWLKANSPDSLERQHILDCLAWCRTHKTLLDSNPPPDTVDGPRQTDAAGKRL